MKNLLGHRFRRTTLVAVFCAAVLAGIGLARVTSFSSSLVILALLFVLAVIRYQQLAACLAIVLLGISLGGLRGTIYTDRLARYEPLYNQKIVMVGTAVNDASYGKQTQLAFDLTNARLQSLGPDGRWHDAGEPLVGEIGVSGFGANVIFRGDTVEVAGKLRPGTGARQGWLSYSTLTVLRSKPGLIDTLRLKFGAGMQSALPEPAASFAMGLLIGQKATLPDSVYQDLLMVGLVHIIAVSGYNLTIILRACLKVLGKRSKYQTFMATIGLIAVFLLITGASASIVRASIVSALSMMAWYYGRTVKPIVLILLAAALTAFLSPLYEWGDIGWYLSFLAFYGVMILGPEVSDRFLRGWFQRSVIVGIALESLCAEIMSLPLVLYIFGQMSFVSLLANVVVPAFVPLAMLLSLVAGLAGMLLTPIVGWFAWPGKLLLTYMLDASHVMASIPGIFRQNVFLSAAGMLLIYGLVVGLNLVLHSRLKTKNAILASVQADTLAAVPALK